MPSKQWGSKARDNSGNDRGGRDPWSKGKRGGKGASRISSTSHEGKHRGGNGLFNNKNQGK